VIQEKEDCMKPEILLHPNIPKPLHGIAPRVVLGEAWWNVERQKAYAAAGYCCEACGIPKGQAAYHRWLEAHEFYKFQPGLLKLERLVALCHACHNFIHDGRMRMLVSQYEISEEKYHAIMAHGFGLLQKAGIKLSAWEDRHDYAASVEWVDWRMEINGKLYGPSSQSFEEWSIGAWRNWRPE
jgi:hypothetical protein